MLFRKVFLVSFIIAEYKCLLDNSNKFISVTKKTRKFREKIMKYRSKALKAFPKESLDQGHDEYRLKIRGGIQKVPLAPNSFSPVSDL